MTVVLIALGSALGGVLRYWLSGVVAAQIGQTFPWGTLVVNILGCFAIACFATLTAPDGRWMVAGEWRQFFMTGVCGGFTTFSSFSWQTLALMQDGQWLWAGFNVGGSVVLCLVGVWLGAVVGGLVNQYAGALRGLF